MLDVKFMKLSFSSKFTDFNEIQNKKLNSKNDFQNLFHSKYEKEK